MWTPDSNLSVDMNWSILLRGAASVLGDLDEKKSLLHTISNDVVSDRGSLSFKSISCLSYAQSCIR